MIEKTVYALRAIVAACLPGGSVSSPFLLFVMEPGIDE
jgi:hypothetical protein